MRVLALLAAGAALMFASTAAATPREEADDRFTEALLTVNYSRAVEGAIVEGSSGAPIMLANPGNAAAVVVGCERRCATIQVTLRAAGMPDLALRSHSQRLILDIPAEYTRALSNFELDIDITCGASACVHRWALLTRGVAQTMQSRGLPRPITEAEWTRAGQTVPLSQIAWQQTPTAEDMRFYYPVRQWRASQGGQARLQCLVADAGVLRCRTDGQSAFNDAALRLSTRLRAPANDASGQPLLNRRVVVPIRFEPQ
jgi:hypothetical protein